MMPGKMATKSVRVRGSTVGTKMLRSNKWGTINRAYAYELRPDGSEDVQAFHDLESRDAWTSERPNRFPTHSADLSKPQKRAAQWWTDTLIGNIK